MTSTAAKESEMGIQLFGSIDQIYPAHTMCKVLAGCSGEDAHVEETVHALEMLSRNQIG